MSGEIVDIREPLAEMCSRLGLELVRVKRLTITPRLVTATVYALNAVLGRALPSAPQLLPTWTTIAAHVIARGTMTVTACPAAGLGQPVDGPFRQPPGPLRLLRLDQAAPLERFDHAIQRAVVEPDSLMFLPLPECRGHLVRVPGPLGQAHQHGQGQRVRAVLGRHLYLQAEYSGQSS